MNITDISPTIRPKAVSIVAGAEGDELSIAWEDGHATKYPMTVRTPPRMRAACLACVRLPSQLLIAHPKRYPIFPHSAHSG